jgi:hypothetical protein
MSDDPLSQSLRKRVRRGTQAHFVYCMSGPDKAPVLRIGRSRAAVLREQTALRPLARQPVFLTGRVELRDDQSGYRFLAHTDAARAITGLRRDLRRTFGRRSARLRRSEVLFLGEEEEDLDLDDGEALVDAAAVLDDEALTAEEQQALAARAAILAWADDNQEALASGFKRAAKRVGRFFRRTGHAIKDFWEVVASTRLGLRDGRVVLRTDLNELMDLLSLKEQLTLNRQAQNRIEIELHPLDKRTIITAESLTLESVSLGDLVTGPATLRGVRIELGQDEDGNVTQLISAEHVEVSGVDYDGPGGPLVLSGGELTGLEVLLLQLTPGEPGESPPSRTEVSLASGSLWAVAHGETFLSHVDAHDVHITMDAEATHAELGDVRATDIDAGLGDIDAHISGLDADNLGVDVLSTGLDVTARRMHTHHTELLQTPGLSGAADVEDGAGLDLGSLVRSGAALVASADADITVPLVDGADIGGYLRVNDATELRADIHIADRVFVPGETRVDITPPLAGPGWLGLGGAYLDETGDVRIDIRGFLDLGARRQLNEALGLDEDAVPTIEQLGRIIAAGMAPGDPTTEPSGGLDPSALAHLDELTAVVEATLHGGTLDGGEALRLGLSEDEDNTLHAELTREAILASFAELVLSSLTLGEDIHAEHTRLHGGEVSLGRNERDGVIDAEVEDIDLEDLSIHTDA